MFTNYQNRGMRFTRIIIHETGTYNKQYRRSYKTTGTGHIVSVFQERLGDTQKVSASQIADIAGQFITPSSEPESSSGIYIPNDWGQRRMRCMIELEIDMGGVGQRIIQNVMAYTSYDGVSLQGTIDPEMEFYVNNVVNARVTRNPAIPNQMIRNIYDASHILSDNSFVDVINSPVRNQSMRPEDVFALMSVDDLGDVGDMFDTRTTRVNSAVKSRRTNAIPSVFASSILTHYNAANLNQNFGQSEQSVYTSARGIAAEASVAKDYFLSAINQVKQTVLENSFTINDLRKIDPNVDNVTTVFLMRNTERFDAHEAGTTQFWHLTDDETVLASSLSQAIPGALMELGITLAVFKCTNYGCLPGQLATVIEKVEGLTPGALYKEQAMMFVDRLENYIMPGITNGGEKGVSIEMSVDILGETWLNISIDGKPPVPYVTPSFCDALTVPIMTANRDVATGLAHDFTALVDGLALDNCPQPNSTSFQSGFGLI